MLEIEDDSSSLNESIDSSSSNESMGTLWIRVEPEPFDIFERFSMFDDIPDPTEREAIVKGDPILSSFRRSVERIQVNEGCDNGYGGAYEDTLTGCIHVINGCDEQDFVMNAFASLQQFIDALEAFSIKNQTMIDVITGLVYSDNKKEDAQSQLWYRTHGPFNRALSLVDFRDGEPSGAAVATYRPEYAYHEAPRPRRPLHELVSIVDPATQPFGILEDMLRRPFSVYDTASEEDTDHRARLLVDPVSVCLGRAVLRLIIHEGVDGGEGYVYEDTETGHVHVRNSADDDHGVVLHAFASMPEFHAAHEQFQREVAPQLFFPSSMIDIIARSDRDTDAEKAWYKAHGPFNRVIPYVYLNDKDDAATTLYRPEFAYRA